MGISAGFAHTCSIDNIGKLFCWGWAVWDQIKVPIVNVKFVAVSAGEQHTCALDIKNKIYCWGRFFDADTAIPI